MEPTYDGIDTNITQLKYWRDGISRGISSPVYMDPVYGSPKYQPGPAFLPMATSKKTLRLPKPDGGYYTQSEAYVELMKPNWNGKSFPEALPILIPNIGSPTKQVSNYTKYPTLPTDPTLLYILRKLYDPQKGIYQFTNAMSFEMACLGQNFGYEEWKISTMPDYHTEPDPDYVNNETIRNEQKLLYEQMLKDTFHLFGTYVFPSLQTNETVLPDMVSNTALQIKEWNKTHPLIPDPNWIPPTKDELNQYRISGTNPPTAPLITSWKESNRWTLETVPERLHNKWAILQNGIWKNIPVMNDYWLASKDGGYIYKQIEIPNNENLSIWDAKVTLSILIVPPGYTWSQRLKNILGL